MEKLWAKKAKLNSLIEEFTIGEDKETDLHLAKWDVLGSIAHVKMLHQVELIEDYECELILNELSHLLILIKTNQFKIEDGVEDVHSQVEHLLVKKLGAIGKKIHTGRSRNDQVLLDIRLYMRNELEKIIKHIQSLFNAFISKSNQYKDAEMPGYTHLQMAMPSSFGLWFGAFAESLLDDLHQMKSAFGLVNKNPLGSAAGYGSSFPVCRETTTKLLGFDDLNYNVIYAQWSRLKVETAVMSALSSVATTISRFAGDACLFMCGNFGFIELPDEYITGSSIMPHKKNPDAFEILRGKMNDIKVHLFRLISNTNNLNTGYFREYQLLKKPLIDSFEEMKECLKISKILVDEIIIKENIMDNEIYHQIYSVDEIDVEVRNGAPFREAYHIVSEKLKNKEALKPNKIKHSLLGSKDNLCNDRIESNFNKILGRFPFEKIKTAYKDLMAYSLV